ncbi:MAG: GTP 3',8-cyclase MoaA [Planctomycetota bacterium]|nr:GTP 3',8-cyclase MoaA [Planctomycetota bacterium]
MTVVLPLFEPGPVRPAFAQGPRSLSSVRLLRLSVTDRCNLRCVYCMPEDGVDFHKQTDLLSARDIVAVARAAATIGVDHFKLTGGEPTVRADLCEIIEGVAGLTTGRVAEQGAGQAPVDVSLTTNGMLLDRLARDLRSAGLQRLTVSLDTLRADRFERIARGGARSLGGLARLLRGLDAAEAAGFERIKINMVVMGGVNDDEVVDFARLSLGRPWTVRFIEYMPLGESTMIGHSAEATVDNAAVKARIEAACGALEPVDRQSEPGVGPAGVWRLPGARGRVGFISAMSRPFCETCNRLRLTASGELRSCLFDGGEVNVLPALRPAPDAERIIDAMRRCVALKPETHSARGNRAMSQLGG